MDALLDLADDLGLPREEVDSAALRRWLHHATDGIPPGGEGSLGSGLATLVTSVSTGATRMAGDRGALRTLVPLTLAFLGLRSLLVTPQLAFPTWYDYLWFAFSSYMVLNPPRQAGG